MIDDKWFLVKTGLLPILGVSLLVFMCFYAGCRLGSYLLGR